MGNSHPLLLRELEVRDHGIEVLLQTANRVRVDGFSLARKRLQCPLRSETIGRVKDLPHFVRGELAIGKPNRVAGVQKGNYIRYLKDWRYQLEHKKNEAAFQQDGTCLACHLFEIT